MNTWSNDSESAEFAFPTEDEIAKKTKKKIKKTKTAKKKTKKAKSKGSAKTVVLAACLALSVAMILGFCGMLAFQYFAGYSMLSYGKDENYTGPGNYHSIEDVPGPGENPNGGQLPDSGTDGYPSEDPSEYETFVPTGPFIYEVDLPDYPLTDAPRVRCTDVGERQPLAVNEISNLINPSVVSVVGFVSDNVSDGYSLGTGTIYSSDGYIITNHHVIEECVNVQVVFPDGDICEAQFIASDADADVAVLKIAASGLTPVEFGRSSELAVGDTVVAIGNPVSLDFAGTTTVGRITGPERYVPVDSAGNIMKMLQTDASINPGNSGGPLINEYGQVIGIVTAKMTADTYEGIGFAIPSDRLEKVVSDLLDYGYVKGFPMLGVTGYTVREGEIDGKNPMGVAVVEVSLGSSAFGKIRVGDVIFSCNGETIYSIPEINAIKSRMAVGDVMNLGVYRNGIETYYDIVLKDKHD